MISINKNNMMNSKYKKEETKGLRQVVIQEEVKEKKLIKIKKYQNIERKIKVISKKKYKEKETNKNMQKNLQQNKKKKNNKFRLL